MSSITSPSFAAGSAAMAPKMAKEGLISGIAESQEKHKLRSSRRRDDRKYRYDLKGVKGAPVSFSATKADRLDAYQAGELLHKLHQALGIASEVEEHIVAFDKALFFEHTLNGASVLQPGRGNIVVGDIVYPIDDIHKILGDDIRRFFRAYADDVAAVNREVLDNYYPANPESVEMHGQLMQVAFDRGIEKFPYLAHDSADACTFLSIEERNALASSKKHVLSQSIPDPYKRFG